MRAGDEITPRFVVEVLATAASAAPPGASVVYVLNKVDSGDRVIVADAVVIELRRMVGDAAVVLARHGEPLVQSTPGAGG